MSCPRKRESRHTRWTPASAGVTVAGSNTFTDPKQELAVNYPPPGQMVDVDGYRLHINCQGREQNDGSPTVVLEAGASQFSLTWDHVQREVAKFTRVCSYDRAGLGWERAQPEPAHGPVRDR